MNTSTEDYNSTALSFSTTMTFNKCADNGEYGNNSSGFPVTPTHPATQIIDKYATPFLYAVGFPGNLMSLLVWIQKDMRHTSGCYLVALAFNDIIVLSLSLVIELQIVWSIPTVDTAGICELTSVLFLASQYLSPLLVLGFTVERYISVCHPFKRSTYCTIQRAMIVISSLSVLSLCIAGIQGYFFVYDEESDSCGPNIDLLKASPNFTTNWNLGVEVFVFILVPLSNLCINIMVIHELRRSSRVRIQDHQGQGDKTSATTVMLLAVSFYHIMTTVPVTVVYSMYKEFPPGDKDISTMQQDPVWQRYSTYQLVLTIIKEWGTSRHAFNIFIYIITGKVFKKVMVRLMCRCKCFVFKFKLQSMVRSAPIVTRNTKC